MKKTAVILSLFSIILCIQSCKTNLKETNVITGNANFSRYVAIGNSLTSGYADGALSLEGQVNSFPKMLSEQFALAGGGSFNVPYMSSGAGSDATGNPRRILGYVLPCNSATPSLSPIFDPNGATTFNNVSAAGPYNLVGVPGARAIDVNFASYGLYNPFFGRFCSNPAVSSMQSEALRINPTFFTLWLGNNDVLLYATSGALPVTGIFSPSLSDTTLFRIALQQMVDSLLINGSKGAMANIPDVTSIPYFTTVPWNGAVISTQGKADTLNNLYKLIGDSSNSWHVGANGFMIKDSLAPPLMMRHATSADLILLTTPGDSLKCGAWGVSPAKPLADAYVLDANEKVLINTYTSMYNSIINNIVAESSNKIALVDMNTFMKTFKSGITYNGITLNANFISGGAFSLDGVHPNPRGYALIANEFIRTINAKFGSRIPTVDVIKYNGIKFP